MGLAASQARLLSITQRLSDNELRAQLINNQKMRLSAESSQVSENYINALNKTNLMFANYDKDDKAQTVPLTFNNLTAFNQYNNQYGLTNTAGNILISEDESKKYLAAQNGKGDALTEFLRLHGIEYTTSYWDTIGEQVKGIKNFYDEKGNYTFFEANELRKMYEEDNEALKITSYNTTIKTQEYTDFSGYLDDFVRAKGDYDNALDQATKSWLNDTVKKHDFTIGGEKINLNNLISFHKDKPDVLFGNSATNLKAFIKQILGEFCDINDTEKTNFINRFFDSSSNEYINLTQSGSGSSSTYTINGNNLDLGIADDNPVYGEYSETNKTPNCLIYKDKNGDQYICIGAVSSIEDPITGANTPIIGWIKMGDDDNTANPKEPGDLNVYQRNSDGEMVKAREIIDSQDKNERVEQDITIASKNSKSNGTFSYNIGEDSNSQQTITITYPTSTGATVGTGSGTKVTTKGSPAAMDEEIEQALTIITEALMEYIKTNAKDVDFSTANEDVKAAMDACINIGQNLADTITGTGKLTISKDNIESLYAYVMNITDGKEVTRDGNGGWTYNKCLDQEVTSNFRNVANAYILDLIMDFFGEPVYQYLYTDGERNKIKEDGTVDYYKVDKGYIVEKNGNSDARAEAEWLINLFHKIETSGYQVIAKGLANSTDWLQFALENGIVVMEQVTQDKTWVGITYSSCSDISEQTAATDITIAEAEYNKAMRQIEAKDEMFDLELKNIDTEHSSLQSEYESVKKAMSGNIERNFQMYG